MRKPEFEQFRQSLIRRSKPLPQQAREPYREATVKLLEGTGEILVQKARKDGHDTALVEIHGSWVGTDFSPEAVMSTLKGAWPGDLFSGAPEMHWIEHEEEVVTLDFACDLPNDQFVTGRVKINV